MKVRKDLSAREVHDLQETLMRRLGDSSVPTLPEVAVKVIKLVGDSNASLKQFVDVVQTDQALTGRLLRTANSALFAQRQPVTQLHRAMVLLGLDRLKAMALGFHLSQAAAKDESDFSFKKVWSLSLFRAWTAFRLTEYFDRTITGEAFIVGLMQDAGIPMMQKLLGDEWSKLVNIADTPQKQHQAELNNLEFTHVDVIGSLIKMWKLPELLSRPIVLHHSSPDMMNAKDQASILHSVAYFVGTMHLDPEDADKEPKGAASAVAKRLFGLGVPELQKTLKNAAADFRASRDMFAHVLDEGMSVEQILQKANRELRDTAMDPAEGAHLNGPAVRFDAGGGMVLEMEPAGSKRVTVYLADATGKRLLSEAIDPAGKSTGDLRQILMLDDLAEDTVNMIMLQMQRLAA